MKSNPMINSFRFLAILTFVILHAVPGHGQQLIPQPSELAYAEGRFTITPETVIVPHESDDLAGYLNDHIERVCGFRLRTVPHTPETNYISLRRGGHLGNEAYTLSIEPEHIIIRGGDRGGVFYGLQTLFQLMPPEVYGQSVASAPQPLTLDAVSVKDGPRYAYRGAMLDVSRTFFDKQAVMQYLDWMSRHKLNKFHWHLTDDNGWRIEIKKYPKLTSVGSIRTEGDGSLYGGFYTQEQIKEIVDYAAKRYITVIPEIDLPGHMMAAISAYPYLSCKGEQWSLRTVWGVEDIVMCPGKEDMFRFLDDIFSEIVPLFPGKYFHIGGDECPKTSWKNCPACQKRIQTEGLQAEGKHSAEERLQSYVIKRIEKMLEKRGRKIIGWDEILEGGLSENATVMSWRGTEGGIEAAMQKHDVIMTPGSDGMYLDWYQGDSKVEPVTIPSPPRYLASTYNYNPVPDTIKALGLAHHILGVQCNNWSEYMYSNAKMEYMMYPRAIALSEIAWSPVSRKNFKDFCRRLDANCVRLDERHIRYHIPLPEQPFGSCDKVVITGDTAVTFTTSRPMKMVYTLDGSTPTPSSSAYAEPIRVSGNTIIKIATILPSGKMSRIRTIDVEKQTYAPAVKVEGAKPGLQMKRIKGNYLKVDQLEWADAAWECANIEGLEQMKIQQKDDAATLRGANNYAAIAEGYINIPEDGVYYLSSRLEQVWIDNKLMISNEGDVKAGTNHDTSVALAKGLHPFKVVFLSNIVGGWPSWWSSLGIEMRKDSEQKFTPVDNSMFFRK